MILSKDRARLKAAFAELVEGRMSNDEFDELYYERCEQSADRGVAEIGGFAYSLYPSDLLTPFYLKGRYTLDPEIRAIAERALLFLRTDLEYGWPDFPAISWIRMVQWYVLAPGCVMSAFLQFPATAADLDVAILPWAVAFGFLRWLDGAMRKAYWKSGPKDAWPFFSEDDLRTEAAKYASNMS